MTNINFDVIPIELKRLKQWVSWRGKPRPDGKLNKIPMNAKTGNGASHSDPETWSSFDVAKAYHDSHSESAGIGFVFSAGDPYVGVDLDNCRNSETGEIEPWASEFIELAKTYCEVSPSGTGVKMILKGVMPSNTGKKKAYKTGAVEMYSHSRFFTITGWQLEANDED